MKLSLKIKPSLLASSFEHKCDKYLVYNTTSNEEHKQLGWDVALFEQSAAAQAGVEWERILLERLEADDTCEVINLKADDSLKVTLKDTVRAIKTLKTKNKDVYIYQACFCATTSFNEKYLSNLKNYSTEIALSSRMYPDFIKAEYIQSEKKYRLTVIDAKNASKIKIGAEIQIALYVKILKAIIKDEDIDNCYVNEDEGIVWNREPITDNKLEHVFKLQDASVEVDKFFAEKAVEICKILDNCKNGDDIQKSLDYRITQQCGYCDNFENCKKFCIKEKNVRLLPYISVAAQDRLCELKTSGILQDDTVESVSKLLKESPKALTDDCSYWKRVKNDIDVYEDGINAYFKGEKERFTKEASSISFPISQNFSLFLTAQQDVNSGRVYAFSWLLKPGKKIDIWNLGFNDLGYVAISEGKKGTPGKGTYYDSVIAENYTDEEFNRVDRIFVEKIYELLEKISNYEDPKKRKLQCFVMDDYEYSNIENTLFNMIDYLDPVEEQVLIEKVMACLFWLQGERLVTDSDLQPEKIVDSPITIITSEISRLYVLSEGVSYGLRKIASIFSPKFNFDEDNGEFFGVLTNVVEGMHIINYWKEKDIEKREKKENRLGYHLRKRLFVESAIVSEVQKDCMQNKIYLSAWPAQYSLQKPRYQDYPEIARLDFENRYEELLKYRQIRGVRMAGIDNAIDNGNILSLEYTGNGNTYKILNNENYVGNEWFCAWLCEDTPENRIQIMILKDKEYTAHPKRKFLKVQKPMDSDTEFYPKGRDMDYNFIDDGITATVDFFADPDAGFMPRKGKRYLLFEVYSDMNSPKTATGIEKLIDRQELLEPKKMSCPSGLVFDDKSREICSKYWSPDGFSFSPSQEKAFIHLFENNLNILVGPPASGKTDFISRSIITLANYYSKAKKKNLKIMVTAMSHSAIENVLLKLDRMLQKSNPGNIGVYKVDKFDDRHAFAGTNVSIIESKNLASHLSDNRIQVIGITSWAAYKVFHNPKTGQMEYFDLIVMDEASQIRAMDSFLNLECSDKNTRFLLVGDDDQLPPIIGGKYKEVEGEKYIHGSIFRMYLTGLGDNHPDIINLSDNFRMNGILCKYSSKTLYGPEYKAFNEAIHTQKISVSNQTNNKVIDCLLDSEYPLVFCEFVGIPREQTEAEIQIVTELVNALWNSQINKDTGELASEAGNFWRDYTNDNGRILDATCGIISPHHEHINKLKTSISNDLGIDRNEIFIGTVDKLQGKERKTVIVSYGVSETEKIMNESEFIFSSNRFNVSLTRGKAKSIVLLSDAIAESNLTTNIMTSNDTKLKKGIDFIHGFSNFMKTEGPEEILVEEFFPNYIGNISLKVWKKKMID